MPRISLVDAAHSLIKTKLRPGDTAIDATVGNGHDTAFLLSQIQPHGHVYGFDIQPAALTVVQQKLAERTSLTLLPFSHADMERHIPSHLYGRIRAVMFNLGYLPGGDKRLVTQTDSTLAALEAACRMLMPEGIITVTAYPGHPGGDSETTHVGAWIAGLAPSSFKTGLIDSRPANPMAPKLFIIEKSSAIFGNG